MFQTPACGGPVAPAIAVLRRSATRGKRARTASILPGRARCSASFVDVPGFSAKLRQSVGRRTPEIPGGFEGRPPWLSRRSHVQSRSGDFTGTEGRASYHARIDVPVAETLSSRSAGFRRCRLRRRQNRGPDWHQAAAGGVFSRQRGSASAHRKRAWRELENIRQLSGPIVVAQRADFAREGRRRPAKRQAGRPARPESTPVHDEHREGQGHSCNKV